MYNISNSNAFIRLHNSVRQMPLHIYAIQDTNDSGGTKHFVVVFFRKGLLAKCFQKWGVIIVLAYNFF